ncbi:MAG: AEC family transporter [Desulfomonilaceae bacterium]
MLLILNSLLPIFAIITLGSALKRIGWIDDSFIKASDKLIYYIFFPCLLFWKIGKPSTTAGIEWAFILGVLCAVFLVFLISLLFVRLFRVPDYEVGSFSQSCYRFSSYIGIAIILSAVGEEGIRQFGILIGFVIPFINVLAVSSMIWYSGESCSKNHRAAIMAKAIVSNPLILACLAGIFYSKLGIAFPTFVTKTFELTSLLSLPLALISIGGSLTFSRSKDHLGNALIAALLKLIVLPMVGYLLLKIFRAPPTPFKVAMIYFALPTSPQNYILSSQLNSDVDLATTAIVLSTLLSIVSLSIVLMTLTQ